MIYAGLPSFYGWGLEEGPVPTLWLLLRVSCINRMKGLHPKTAIGQGLLSLASVVCCVSLVRQGREALQGSLKNGLVQNTCFFKTFHVWEQYSILI